MVIFDKPKWHIDAGMNINDVLEKFKLVFDFLADNDMLSDDGREQIEIGIDEECSLNEMAVNKKGKSFLEFCYDDLINYNSKDMAAALDEKLISYNKLQEQNLSESGIE